MLDDSLEILRAYYPEALSFYLDLIRGNNPASFTRHRKLDLSDLLLQMLNRQGKTQWAELEEYFDFMAPVSDKAFFQARMKFNPEAIHVMANEYIANVYDNYDDSMKKWNDLLVLAIDGSKCIVPNTRENMLFFGVQEGNSSVQPAMALISTLHDSLNNLKLDLQVDSIIGSEKALAAKHIDHFCDNYTQKALFTFDRGYPSIRLIDQIIARNQYFLFRTKSTDYKKYFDQVKVGEDKVLELTFDRVATNEYRNDRQFRQHLMNTTYKLRFAKVVIGKDEEGNDIVETLLTNLPSDQFSTEDLKDCYWQRWSTETSYNRLKNRMKMEEFSGYKPELILQDFYADMWVYNLVSLKIIRANERKPIEQPDGEYTISRNFNKAVGTIKHLFLKTLTAPTAEERERALRTIDTNIESNIIWVKNEKRVFERKTAVNKSAMSYRKTY